MKVQKSNKIYDTEFLSREECIALADKDYLTLPEIKPRILAQVRPDMLYRTHAALHRDALAKPSSKRIISAHAKVADEIITRKFMHHQWDKLDAIYKNK